MTWGCSMARKRTYGREALKYQYYMASVSGDVTSGIIAAGEGPGIDIVTNMVGLGLDSVLLAHANGSPASEYATLTLALAAAASGDIVWIARPSTFTEDIFIPAGVSVVGMKRGTIIAGTVTLSTGASIENVTIRPAATSAAPLVGLTIAGSGEAHAYSCTIAPQNSGNGGVRAVVADDFGDLICHECWLDGTGNLGGGVGYAGYRASGGSLRIEGGTCLGSNPADPFNE